MRRGTLFASATEDELYVAQILFNLREIISISKSISTWGCKRRRSSLEVLGAFNFGSSDEIEQRRPQVKPADGGAVATTSTTDSPNTPLSVSFTESDEKNTRSVNTNSNKREIENVRKYYNELKTCNSKLKSMRQKVLKTCSKKEQLQMDRSPREKNIGMELTKLYEITVLPHQQPLIADRTAQRYLYSFDPFTTQLHSSRKELGSDNNVGRVPDLNIVVEEGCAIGVNQPQPLDMDRVLANRRRFAEARRLRKVLIKIKSMRRACGIKCP